MMGENMPGNMPGLVRVFSNTVTAVFVCAYVVLSVLSLGGLLSEGPLWGAVPLVVGGLAAVVVGLGVAAVARWEAASEATAVMSVLYVAGLLSGHLI